jgi:hypothetical protein
MRQEEHPDLPQAQQGAKRITRGGMQAIEDKAIAEYMKAYEERGREEAERIYFSFFNKIDHGKEMDFSSRRNYTGFRR